MNPEDVSITRFYMGPGKGSSMELVHEPTGISVAEAISADSTEPNSAIKDRLLSALKLKIKKEEEE